MDFGIMFFSSADQALGDRPYGLLLDAARFADDHGFVAVWTPERHFHPFGGLFPNPAVTSAALATITERLEIRAGSLISPLHDPIRIAEEWSVVDNLSAGRVAVSFGSGWNVDDFVFFPDRYETRVEIMFEQIRTVQSLWSSTPLERVNSYGKTVSLTLHPRPVQRSLPIWITSSGNPATFERAGRIGANLLTHLVGQDVAQLGEKLTVYREARSEAGFDPTAGRVALMLHTYLADDLETARSRTRSPMTEYLRSAVRLEQKAARGGGVISGGKRIDVDRLDEADMDRLLDLTFDRYVRRGSLIGTPESCQDLLWELTEIGVDEIACLIDFGVAEPEVLRGLERLDELRRSMTAERVAAARRAALDSFVEDLEEA